MKQVENGWVQVLFEVELGESILLVETRLKDRVDVIPYKTNSVVRVELFWSHKGSPDLKEDLTVGTGEDARFDPVLQALLGGGSAQPGVVVFVVLDHLHDKVSDLLTNSTLEQLVFGIKLPVSTPVHLQSLQVEERVVTVHAVHQDLGDDTPHAEDVH